jgi:hypothetical protein
VVKASASYTDKVNFSIEQEGTHSGILEPGQCKYFVISRITGIYVIIIRLALNGEIIILERRIKGPLSKLLGGKK